MKYFFNYLNRQAPLVRWFYRKDS